MKDVLRAIERGESITVLHRGTVKACISPVTKPPGVTLPIRFLRGNVKAGLWNYCRPHDRSKKEFRVLPLIESISHFALALIEEHARRDGLGVACSLIAATARENGETLATGNVKHFRRIGKRALKAFGP